MSQAGRFITFEGGEGTGKSTQARRLAAQLNATGLDCLVTREPGGSPGAEEIRKLLVEGAPGRWDVLTETLMMFAARTDHLGKTIKPALQTGRWVVCDRFTDSTYVYQGAGRGLDENIIAAIEAAALAGFAPDLTLILDLPVETGLKRAHARRGSETRFEQFDRAFHDRLRQGYLARAGRDPQRCVVIDAGGDEECVAARIRETVRQRLRV